MPLYVGTSGWQYRDWRGSFYPEELPQRAWLEHYAARFRTVEVNNTFYRLPEAEVFDDWAARTPDDFVVVCKLSRYLTHVRRLRDPRQPMSLFFQRARGLGEKTGPVLLQLPPNMKADVGSLADALDARPPGARVAVEFRHDSWFRDDVAACLAERDAALCLTDRRARPQGPLWRTVPWGYVRFHEGTATPRPCYGDAALGHWAERLAELWPAQAEVFVFFNNDPRACAVRDAVRFARLAERAGLRPTRVPSPAEVSVSRV
jgi:uncharacterized protein YecE (DUF72 family)